ncbi:hypothetical protein [Burkholderia ubonensis]|uniref:hypothetical protein n=1 Tax=Burkholderia ubonensis TaxID=101571 RepID=UPI000A719D97|nr:hypothetical protein [Burkholderia ubonensis]
MTVFDEIFYQIRQEGYHNQRRETHSDLISHRIIDDLRSVCRKFSEDYESGIIKVWHKTKGPDNRTTDLLAGVPNPDGTPNLSDVRLLVEHKSVITAHRNRNARFQDIDRERLSAHAANPRTIVVATLLVGTCERVLNVPDCVAKHNKGNFEERIRPRLSTGDDNLWRDFSSCVSENKVADATKTIEMFRQLPVRAGAHTHLAALDYLLIAPVRIDNVNPPCLALDMGIDPIHDYNQMIRHICRLYDLRWHDGP